MGPNHRAFKSEMKEQRYQGTEAGGRGGGEKTKRGAKLLLEEGNIQYLKSIWQKKRSWRRCTDIADSRSLPYDSSTIGWVLFTTSLDTLMLVMLCTLELPFVYCTLELPFIRTSVCLSA